MHLPSCLQSVASLRDSSHVVRFQQYFGLQIVRDGDDDGDDASGSAVAKSTKDRSKIGAGAKALSANGTAHQVRQAAKYRVDNYFWYYLFSLGSKLGYELFYSLSFSYFYWNLDSFVCRRLMLVWATLMYIGQALKEIIQWPRPSGSNVIILEPEYAFEYGMPSTHAILALSIPANLFNILLSRYEFSIPIFAACALAWCSLICCSRLYLGMHSLLDIIAGLGLTAILLVPLLPAVDQIDRFLIQNWSAPLVTLGLVIFFASIYPKTNNLSPSRGDTCVMIAATAGVYIGSWLHFHLGITHLETQSHLFRITFPPAAELPILLVRTTLGLVVIAAFRFLGKAAITQVLRHFFAIDTSQRHQARVEVPTKLFTYLAVGLALAFVAPVLFIGLHIGRASLYSEA